MSMKLEAEPLTRRRESFVLDRNVSDSSRKVVVDETVVCERGDGDINSTTLSPDDTFVVEEQPVQGTRLTPRYQCTKPLAIVPVALDGSPCKVQWSEASSVDFSEGGVCFQLESHAHFDSSIVVIGVDTRHGRRYGVALLAHQNLVSKKLRIGARWLTEQFGDPFVAANLRPSINPQTLTFGHRCNETSLDGWAQLGVLRKYLIDRVLVCPKCAALPTWRKGCHRCGSGRITQDRLLHHFACAHVGAAGDFETTDGLQCPKCRTKHLIVGSDFEFIDAPVQCLDCGGEGGLPTMSAMCHRCYERFDESDVREQLLYGYALHRLDPIKDLIEAPPR